MEIFERDGPAAADAAPLYLRPSDGPEAKILFTGEATGVLARTLGGGDIAFLPGHAPFIGALADHEVIVHPETGPDVIVAVHSGFVEVSDNRITILADSAELVSGA